MTVPVLLGAALLGGLGCVARVLADGAIMARVRAGGFPVGILVVNVSGSLALGVLAGAGAGEDVLRVAGVGLLGGYTTFSAWMLDTDRLAREGRRGPAAVNIAFGLLAGLGAVWLGRELGLAL